MKFAFCIFTYYPYGGLGRNFIRIAKELIKRGHTVDLYATRWDNEIPNNLNVTMISSNGITNHSRAKSYVKNLQQVLNNKHYHAVVGFNKMPGLDVFYAADVCYEEDIRKRHGKMYRLTPRYKTYAQFERDVFSPQSKTHVMLISEDEKQYFIQHYDTQAEHFHLLPPGISKDRIAPNNAAQIRSATRNTYHIAHEQKLILLIGSNFHLKGVDRALYAIAALPKDIREKIIFWIIGKGKQSSFMKLAKKLKLDQQVKFIGLTLGIPHLLLAADLLIHPARREAAGMAILEAIVAGLPVLTTDVCGFSEHVKKANAGLVVNSPYQQSTLNSNLQRMLTSDQQNVWKENGIHYAQTTDLYSRAEKACDIIEKVAANAPKPDEPLILQNKQA